VSKKQSAIIIVMENIPAFIATAKNVIQRALKVFAPCACLNG
jgi:hypothetical protein